MKKNNYERRIGALTRLEAQQESDTKNSDGKVVSLTEKDRKRITKEVEVLSTRLKSA